MHPPIDGQLLDAGLVADGFRQREDGRRTEGESVPRIGIGHDDGTLLRLAVRSLHIRCFQGYIVNTRFLWRKVEQVAAVVHDVFLDWTVQHPAQAGRMMLRAVCKLCCLALHDDGLADVEVGFGNDGCNGNHLGVLLRCTCGRSHGQGHLIVARLLEGGTRNGGIRRFHIGTGHRPGVAIALHEVAYLEADMFAATHFGGTNGEVGIQGRSLAHLHD